MANCSPATAESESAGEYGGGLSSSSSSTPIVRSANVFNPKILDASIRDVTSCLSDDQKADVLLSAMGHLELGRSVIALLSTPCPV